MKIIFMGTPDFACLPLKKLIDDKNHQVIALYCAQEKKQNRGQKITKCPTNQLADKYNIPVFTPKSLKDTQEQQKFIDLKADIAIVVAYGLLLPNEILTAPKYGCINIHPSALPKYRGAAPIQRTLMNGETETAICIVQMVQKLDAGPILTYAPFPLVNKTNYKALHNIMANLGANLLPNTLKRIENNETDPVKQDDKKATYAHKIDKKECKIDFNNTAYEIYNQIKGLSGYNEAYFEYQNQKIKIHDANIASHADIYPFKKDYAGEVIDDKLSILCAQGVLKPTTLQKQGKKPLALEDFLRGNPIKAGQKLN